MMYLSQKNVFKMGRKIYFRDVIPGLWRVNTTYINKKRLYTNRLMYGTGCIPPSYFLQLHEYQIMPPFFYGSVKLGFVTNGTKTGSTSHITNIRNTIWHLSTGAEYECMW